MMETVEQWIIDQDGEYPVDLDLGEAKMMNTDTYLKYITELAIYDTIPETSCIVEEESNVLFCRYILGRYKYWKVSDDWFRKFINILVRTYDEYKTLIDIYDDNKSKLFDSLKTTTKSKFNDTPQEYGTYTDDSHMTNYNETTTETDVNSTISKIREIVKKIEDIYQLWANEFSDLFMPDCKIEL